jgi:hypothetical protein
VLDVISQQVIFEGRVNTLPGSCCSSGGRPGRNFPGSHGGGSGREVDNLRQGDHLCKLRLTSNRCRLPALYLLASLSIFECFAAISLDCVSVCALILPVPKWEDTNSSPSTRGRGRTCSLIQGNGLFCRGSLELSYRFSLWSDMVPGLV